MNRIFQISNTRIREIVEIIKRAVVSAVDEVEFITLADQKLKDKILRHRSVFSPFEDESIFCFKVFSNDDKAYNYEDLKVIYEALYAEMGEIFGGNDRVLNIPVLIGQPVKVGQNKDGTWKAYLRLAISSNLISDVSRLEDEMIKLRVESDMNIIFKKIEFILKNFKELKYNFKETV
jgi:hypothetical protein